jgi:polysaccharide export outer membrane protein
LTDLADRHITLKERSTGRLIPYFVSNQADVALDTQVMVYPGDSIDVARVGIVYVLGDVGRPGGYPMATNRSRITVLEATAIAGGTNKTAVPAHAKLIHKTNDGFQEIDIDLSAMQKGQVADRYLEADDILYIPFSYLKNFAVGADGLVAAAATAAIYHF